MDVIDGVDLIDFFNGIMITEEVYLRYVFRKVIEALNQLHVAGVAHRDIKPDNVMLTHKFDIKLVDLGYGIELTGRKNDGQMTTVVGTKMYQPPEMLVDGPVSYKGSEIDIFSLGAMMLLVRLRAEPFEEASVENDKQFKDLVENPK